jgi:hypothetical protein
MRTRAGGAVLGAAGHHMGRTSQAAAELSDVVTRVTEHAPATTSCRGRCSGQRRVPTRPAGYTGDGLTGRLWNTTSWPCGSSTHSLTHTPSWVYRRRAHGPRLEHHQLPHGRSTHSLTCSAVSPLLRAAAASEPSPAATRSAMQPSCPSASRKKSTTVSCTSMRAAASCTSHKSTTHVKITCRCIRGACHPPQVGETLPRPVFPTGDLGYRGIRGAVDH